MLTINFYAPRWGSEHISWYDFLNMARENSYQGIEVYPLQTPGDKPEMLKLLADKGLEFSLLHSEMKEGRDFKKYTAALEHNLYELATYQTNAIKPQFITTQTGREYYTKDQVVECFAICDRISKETAIPILQETHRNKWAYAAHVVKDYLHDFPSLKLTLDLSHWVCVSESYLEDQPEAIDLAIKHGVHLHARVGHIEGPQVTDPRAPENEEALKFHLQWWDKWVNHLIKEGVNKCTITPEFGPYPYMAHQCNTTKPIASQWDINCFIKDLLKERYSKF